MEIGARVLESRSGRKAVAGAEVLVPRSRLIGLPGCVAGGGAGHVHAGSLGE